MVTQNTDDADNLPNLHVDEAVSSEPEARNKGNKENFRGRESSVRDSEYDELPSVNRRSGTNKLVTWMGFLVIMGIALAAIVSVNKTDNGKSGKAKNLNEKIANNLPPLIMPQTAATSIAQPQTPPPIPLQTNRQTTPAKNGKPVLDWTERKMQGNLLVAGQSSSPSEQPKNGAVPLSGQYPNEDDDKENKTQDDLAAQFVPTVTKGVSAALLPDRDYLIAKGTSLDCVLETAISTVLAGLTTCRLTRDVYSDNNHVVLLDRGSELVGEMKGGIRQGQVRVGVLWTRAKTPNGVIINLNSLGTDSLGRSGLEGWVDNHFLERFGAAILVSLVETTTAVAANRLIPSNGSGTTNNFGGGIGGSGGGQQVVESILKSQVNIPPTIIKNQGESLQVMVARDLDFSDVYSLKAKE